MERLNTVPQDSLHAFLRQYIELEDRYLNEFYEEKHADTFDYNKPFVYKFKYIYKDGTEYEWDTVFSCFDALYESIMEAAYNEPCRARKYAERNRPVLE